MNNCSSAAKHNGTYKSVFLQPTESYLQWRQVRRIHVCFTIWGVLTEYLKKTTEWIDMNSGTDIHVPHRMNPYDVHDPDFLSYTARRSKILLVQHIS